MKCKCVTKCQFFKQLPQLLSEISFPTKNHEIKLLPGSDCNSEIYIRSKLVLNGFGMTSNHTYIKTINIMDTEVNFQDVNFSGHIVISPGSRFKATNCIFNCSQDNQDSIIEISPQTTCEFTNCQFSGGKQASITSNGPNSILFNNCSFLQAPVTSLVLSNETNIKLFNCKFQGAQKYAVLQTKKTNSTFISCDFSDMKGKAIGCCTESILNISDCKFSNCENGAICSANLSIIKITKSEFKNISPVAVNISKGSNGYIEGCTFDSCLRSLVCQKSYVDVNHSDFIKSTLLLIGKYCPLLITNSKFSDLDIVISDYSNPIFRDNTTDKVLVRTGDYAKPLFINTPFNELVSSNCSQVILNNSPRKANKQVLGSEIIEVEKIPFELQRSNGIFSYSENDYQVPEKDLEFTPEEGHKDMPLLFIPCGHLCKEECSSCPVCGISGKTTKRYKTDNCVICMDAEPDLVYMPCGHQCCCHECMSSCDDCKKCPICGVPVCSVKKMFM